LAERGQADHDGERKLRTSQPRGLNSGLERVL
jgi:hypothetical protein